MDEHCLMLGWVLHAGVNSSFYAGCTVVVKTSTCWILRREGKWTLSDFLALEEY